MSSNVVYLSKERLQQLEKELQDLKTNGRKDMAVKIAEARSYGDLSENAEYDAAKEAQGLHELRISKIEDILARAVIADTSKFPTDEVHILSVVIVKNRKNEQTYKYTLVAQEEADFEQGKIAINSPVGRGLTGKKVGEITAVNAPAGVIEYEILEINNN